MHIVAIWPDKSPVIMRERGREGGREGGRSVALPCSHVSSSNSLPAVCTSQVRNFYIELLKRMDDSNDRIRIECASAFEKFMASVPRSYDPAQYDYIVRGLVVHLDDQNKEVPMPCFRSSRPDPSHACSCSAWHFRGEWFSSR